MVLRKLSKNEGGLLIGQNKIRLLGYDEDLDIIGKLLADTVNAVRLLEEAVKRMGLKIN
ncbi:Hypothetical protein CINCED_3A014957, partial [Cinara cedri]